MPCDFGRESVLRDSLVLGLLAHPGAVGNLGEALDEFVARHLCIESGLYYSAAVLFYGVVSDFLAEAVKLFPTLATDR
jgi:hypothetical protein